MKPDQVNLFRTLEPPAGGVERFRRRLEDADAAAQRRPARPMLAAGLAAALIAVVVISFDQLPGVDDLRGASDTGPSTPESVPTANDASRESDATNTTNRGAETRVAVASEFRTSPAFARLLGEPAGTTETRISVDDKQVAIAEIPSTNSKIRIYEIRDN